MSALLLIGWAVNVVMAAMIPELIAVGRRRSRATEEESVSQGGES